MYSNGKTLDTPEKISCIIYYLQLIFSIVLPFRTIISQNNFQKNNIFHEDFFANYSSPGFFKKDNYQLIFLQNHNIGNISI